mmetsp:Transcript_42708/g.117889  ORF Transcript_42708/g.117889 Transcript_42708/m.117889 type:complete len:210 (-) Transcript_42708:108-737(-)
MHLPTVVIQPSIFGGSILDSPPSIPSDAPFGTSVARRRTASARDDSCVNRACCGNSKSRRGGKLSAADPSRAPDVPTSRRTNCCGPPAVPRLSLAGAKSNCGMVASWELIHERPTHARDGGFLLGDCLSSVWESTKPAMSSDEMLPALASTTPSPGGTTACAVLQHTKQATIRSRASAARCKASTEEATAPPRRVPCDGSRMLFMWKVV